MNEWKHMHVDWTGITKQTRENGAACYSSSMNSFSQRRIARHPLKSYPITHQNPPSLKAGKSSSLVPTVSGYGANSVKRGVSGLDRRAIVV
mmetsp:Transcript_53806/g.80297  ORF Transcript_53806/g.80297 Transcript_53806/m.80297 type:complete len:91 (-) Transcript_53806:206-478(-)